MGCLTEFLEAHPVTLCDLQRLGSVLEFEGAYGVAKRYQSDLWIFAVELYDWNEILCRGVRIAKGHGDFSQLQARPWVEISLGF